MSSPKAAARGQEERDRGLRHSREELRRVHREGFAKADSQKGCGQERIPNGKVEIYRDPEDPEQTWVFGVRRCGSVWACPVCSRRKCIHRGRLLEACVDVWRELGGTVVFLTPTIPHHKGHRLEQVYEAWSKTWTSLVGSTAWGKWRERLGIEYVVKGVDLTHGAHGWHPHGHILLFLDRPLEEAAEGLGRKVNEIALGMGLERLRDVARACDYSEPEACDREELLELTFTAWLKGRWGRKIRSWYEQEDGTLDTWPLNHREPEDFAPFFGEPHPRHGLRVVYDALDAGAYVARMGLGAEASRMDVKRGRGEHSRTPIEILDDWATHRRERDADLWREYRDAMKHNRHLTGLSAIVEDLLEGQEGDEQPEDAEELEEAAGDEPELLARVGDRLWSWVVVRHNLADFLPGVVAERGLEGGQEWLQGILQIADCPGEVRVNHRRKELYLEVTP